MPPTRTDTLLFKQHLNLDQGASSSQKHVFTGPTSIIRGKACHQCRKRKEGCDGVRPTCGRCLKRGLENCEFDNPEEDWGKMRQLTHHVERLTAELNSVLQEIDTLKQVLEERNIAKQKMMMVQDQPVTPPDPHFLSLTYNQLSMQPSVVTSSRPHESPEFTTVNLTWDPQPLIYPYSRLDCKYYPPPSTSQSMDCADDEDVPMVDLDTIIYLDRLDPP